MSSGGDDSSEFGPRERARRHVFSLRGNKWEKTLVYVSISKSPFAEGAMRYAYLCRVYADKDTDEHEVCVIKFSKESGIDKSIYFTDVRSQSLAKVFAMEYNKREPPKKVDFLDASVVELVDRHGRPLGHCEPYVEGEYSKYNTNLGKTQENDKRCTPQAFSHFTFEHSGQQLLVCDIQGVDDMYTDPQILSQAGGVYGLGDVGATGMRAFMARHQCNSICGYLGLPYCGDTRKERAMTGTPHSPLAGSSSNDVGDANNDDGGGRFEEALDQRQQQQQQQAEDTQHASWHLMDDSEGNMGTPALLASRGPSTGSHTSAQDDELQGLLSSLNELSALDYDYSHTTSGDTGDADADADAGADDDVVADNHQAGQQKQQQGDDGRAGVVTLSRDRWDTGDSFATSKNDEDLMDSILDELS